MFARNASFHLKSNMLSDYTRTLENEILPLLCKQKGFKDEIIVKSWQPGCDFDQSVGEQSQCRSLQHEYLPRSVEGICKIHRWNAQNSAV